jgi:uncharacterized protein
MLPTRDLNALIVSSLLNADATQHAPLIQELYQNNLAEITMNGDLENVEISLGIRDKRSTEKPNYNELEDELSHQARRDELGPPPDSDDPLDILSYFLDLHRSRGSMLSASQLDGFLLACICSPQVIMPSHYIPLIWDSEGDPKNGPVWDSIEEAQLFSEALMNQHNAGVEALRGEAFAPVAILEDRGAGMQKQFRHWALGALHGVALWDSRSKQTKEIKDELRSELLELIRLEDENEDSMEGVVLPPLHRALDLLQEAHEHPQQSLPDGLGGSFLSPRDPVSPQQRETPKIGRNDPCPCGSGRKYKKCCMN